MTEVIRDKGLAWVEFEIPDSNGPVELGRFWRDRETKAMTALVKFPSGWARPVFGHYEADEEFFLLEGDLQIGEAAYVAGDFGIWKKGLVRGASTSASGALTLAHFGGPPRWSQGGAPLEELTGVRFRYKEVEPQTSPFGVNGKFVGSAWVIEEDGGAAPREADAEVFFVAERAWAWVPAGEAVPNLKRPVIAWLRDPGGYHLAQRGGNAD
jgi:hypothetical protein